MVTFKSRDSQGEYDRSSSAHPCLADLRALVREVFVTAGARYGSPRITAALRIRGIAVGRRRVIAAMQAEGLCALSNQAPRIEGKRLNCKRIRRERALSRCVSDDRVRRRFKVPEVNRVWCADISELPTGHHLTLVLDLASRKVVGMGLSRAPTALTATRALSRAFESRGLPRGVIVHTDRGGAFASRMFQSALRVHGAVASMSRRHNPWDNAVAESMFATLKRELRRELLTCPVRDERRIVISYLRWYNDERLHSTLGHRSPTTFELEEYGYWSCWQR